MSTILDVDAHLHRAASDRERSAQFLARASWTIVAVLAAMGLSIWFVPIARATGRLLVARTLGIGFLFELVTLIGVVLALRRRLATQIEHVAEQHTVLQAQNERLVEQNGHLARQAETLQQQSGALERQARMLEAQMWELEASTRVLRESEAQQRALTAETRLLNRRLAEAQGIAELAYWEIDAATKAVYWSDEMYRLVGLTPGIVPVPTDRFLECVHPEDQARMQETAAAAVEHLAEFSEQYRILAPNGKVRTVLSRARVLVDERGERRLVGTVQDISEQVELEARLRQARKLEAMGTLAGGVAHDFNNMLTAVGGCSRLLLAAADDDPPQRPLIEEIITATDQATSLTRQLLAFSRGQVLNPRVVHLGETVSASRALVTRLIGEDIDVVFQLDAEVVPVLADPDQLMQVLINLVVNARDAMPEGGRLSIETATVTLSASYAAQYEGMRAGRHAMMAVTDSGVGMSSETQSRIFEPFFTTKPEGRGTGLGLSTVFGIVQQAGGSIWVYSEPDRGTVFKIYLPEFEGQRRDAAEVAPSNSMPRIIGATVLMVEDDDAVRRVTRTVLQRAGYLVLEAANGAEALDVIRDARVDVVVTDTVMPVMGGRELARRLAGERPEIPVVLTSGYTADTLQRQGPMPDLMLFVEKPFTPSRLDDVVQEALRRVRAA